jgi:uncharacterized membrane protein HdeD (DUF308 family)
VTNIKDTLSTICGVLLAIAGAILSLQTTGIILPAWVNTTTMIVAAIASAIIAYLTGKNPNGKAKSNNQISTQNAQAAADKK